MTALLGIVAFTFALILAAGLVELLEYLERHPTHLRSVK